MKKAINEADLKPPIEAGATKCPECGSKLLTATYGAGGSFIITNGMFNVQCKNGHEFYQPLTESEKVKIKIY